MFQMHTLTQLTGLLVLLFLAFRDIRCRKFPLWVLILLPGLALLCRLMIRSVSAAEVLSGAGIGALFLLISKVTGEGLGYADSGLILALGVFVGASRLLILLAAAFFLAAIFAGVGLIAGKFTRKFSFPFIPFLAVSYAGVLLI